MNRKEQIKAYLERLGEGEALESVRADFVKEFQGVDAGEILLAEQALLKEGTPWQEVQRLCDVHSALFHEKIEEEETEISEGHPLDTLLRENRKLEGLLAEGREAIKRGSRRAGFAGTAPGDFCPLCKEGGFIISAFKGKVWN